MGSGRPVTHTWERGALPRTPVDRGASADVARHALTIRSCRDLWPDKGSGHERAPVKPRRAERRRWGGQPPRLLRTFEVAMSFRRLPLAAFAFAALTAAGAAGAASSLGAQAAPAAPAADSLAFPRRVFAWVRQSQADSVFAHAAEPMKTRLQSPANVTAMMGQLAAQIGAYKSTE